MVAEVTVDVSSNTVVALAAAAGDKLSTGALTMTSSSEVITDFAIIIRFRVEDDDDGDAASSPLTCDWLVVFRFRLASRDVFSPLL